jgi:aconitate hydratase
MGVLPLQFKTGESLRTHNLDGTESYAIHGISDGMTPRKTVVVTATRADGSTATFDTTARIDSKVECGYFQNGGILQTVLRRLMTG